MKISVGLSLAVDYAVKPPMDRGPLFFNLINCREYLLLANGDQLSNPETTETFLLKMQDQLSIINYKEIL